MIEKLKESLDAMQKGERKEIKAEEFLCAVLILTKEETNFLCSYSRNTGNDVIDLNSHGQYTIWNICFRLLSLF
jgi:hypothetical protein